MNPLIRPNPPKETNQPNRTSRTAAEIRRFQAWLEERRVSTAPVNTWPPDELDYFGGSTRRPRS